MIQGSNSNLFKELHLLLLQTPYETLLCWQQFFFIFDDHESYKYFFFLRKGLSYKYFYKTNS